MQNINNTTPICEIDSDWNLTLSHGIESNYLVTGEALKMLVDHINYLHVLIENCAGPKSDEKINNEDKYLNLLKEFFPYIANEARIAVECGPPPPDHAWACNNDCPDCIWYAWGLFFQERVKKGEFSEILS